MDKKLMGVFAPITTPFDEKGEWPTINSLTI